MPKPEEWLEAKAVHAHVSTDRVIKTGSPMCEVLAHYAPKIAASDALPRLGLEAGRYFVVSAHREENIDSDVNLAKLAETLKALATTGSTRAPQMPDVPTLAESGVAG